MKYHIITYGCQMNQSDSQRIRTVFKKAGLRPTSKINEADFLVINMCSVRQSAVDRIYGQIQKLPVLKKENPRLKTILTGCILKSDKEKFLKNFDFVLDIKSLSRWPEYLEIKNRKIKAENYFNIRPERQNKFSAFIPISNGCNNFCAYCVVPFTRGPLVCRSHKEILKEIKNAVKEGKKPIRNEISNEAREIWLLGQNVNDYRSGLTRIKTRKNAEVNFAKLLKMVNDIPGKFWIRFTSPHPKDFSDELIETMAKCKKIPPYLNLPVQSGDDQVLRKMNRLYTLSEYKKIIKKLRKAVPNIALSTDAIVGFPGETKKQFENTIKLFKEIKFDMAYIAKFSPRPGTAAAKMKDMVSAKEKEKRYKALTKILKDSALENNKKYIGKKVKVLVEKEKDGFLLGKTNTYKTVKFLGPRNLTGKFTNVLITKALAWGLEGTKRKWLPKKN